MKTDISNVGLYCLLTRIGHIDYAPAFTSTVGKGNITMNLQVLQK